ncbi:hypothetical protein K7432_009076 [Basidiobolus ranarum]|uniref:Uncharacterized protein n=1 Tax=Basidiobolus ranarum TaxID=34480 RepID=A0ABR2VXM1_9FUNG
MSETANLQIAQNLQLPPNQSQSTLFPAYLCGIPSKWLLSYSLLQAEHTFSEEQLKIRGSGEPCGEEKMLIQPRVIILLFLNLPESVQLLER